jgi:hypothetical protein
MLQIKTITENSASFFDMAVNNSLEEGWELVRRECFITGSDRATTFYAELERIVEEIEDDPEDELICAEWKISRDPAYPYKCTSCGCKVQEPIKNCPHCHKIMLGTEE